MTPGIRYKTIRHGFKACAKFREKKAIAALIKANPIGLSAQKSEDIIQDPDSLNTYQNAVNVKKILSERGIDRVLLVTSAMHMPRSLAIFKHLEINAIAAPTDFLVTKGEIQELSSTPKGAILNLLPDSKNLHNFTLALKEYIGMVVYRLRGWV